MNGWQIFVEITGRPPVEIRPGESLVGRSRTCQVHIPETTVSRQHARLIASALGEVTVEDLGSSNGTFVNGEKTEGRKRLADGDRILIGDAEMRMRIVAPVAPTEATVRLTLPPLSQMAPPGAPPPLPPAAPAAQSAPPPIQLGAQQPELGAWDDTPPHPIELSLEPPPAQRPAPAPPPPAAAPSAPPAFVLPPAPPPIAAPAPPPLPPRPAVPPPPQSQFSAVPPPPAPRPPAPMPPPAAPQAFAPAPAPRPIDPPLQTAPPPRPAPPAMAPPSFAPPPRPAVPPVALGVPPPAAPVAAPPRAVAPPPVAPAAPPAAPKRKDELGSVTVIDRIPIPEPPPAVVQAAKLERARPAGFWIRVLAYLIDFLPMLVIMGAAAVISWSVSTTLGLLVNLLALPYWAYDFVVMPAQKATTFGKKAVGLLIVHPSVKAGQGLGWSVAIIRVLGQFVSGIVLGVGYLLVAFTSQKQGLHDMIAGTRVVRVR